MTDTRNTENAENTADAENAATARTGRVAGRFRGRAVAAFAGTAALVALSFGMAFAADSGEDPATDVSPSPAPTSDVGATGGESDGGIGVGDSGSTGDIGTGDSEGTGDTGGTGGIGTDPSPTSTEVPDVTTPPEPGDGTVPPDPTAGLDQRLAELEEKVDQLPTKGELADALRAFADELEK